MYDTSRRKALFEQVNDRCWPALHSVITKWVVKGRIVVTDEWKAYNRLPSEGYLHSSANHSKNFKEPTTGQHTNAIEAYWSRLKRKLYEGGPDKLLAVLLKTFFTESKTRISSEALALSSDLIELFIEESLARTASEAKKVGRSEAVIEDFESILIQLTLDFAG
nr:unnamed protein product [Spirometra erinaceieuropaei]